MAYSTTITLNLPTGSSYNTESRFTVSNSTPGEKISNVTYTELINGYVYIYETSETSGFTVTSENGVCSGSFYTAEVTLPTATPTPTATGVDPTATPTPTPTGAGPNPTATPTPTATQYVQQWGDFFISNQDYNNTSTACAATDLGTRVFFTSSIGTSFSDVINNLPVQLYTTSDLDTLIGGIGNFYGADAVGPSASYALRINSGTADFAYDCSTPDPTATPIPYEFYELRGATFNGTVATGWNSSAEACNSTLRTSVGEIRVDSAVLPVSESLPLPTNTYFYTSSQGPGSEFNGGGYWYIHEVSGSSDIAYYVDSLGQITLDPVICT